MNLTRPKNSYNQQLCQDIKIDTGLNIYGLANETPNNPLYYALANMRYGVTNGAFMKQTATGTSLPNPVDEFKKIIKPPSASSGGSTGGISPPPPPPERLMKLNTYQSRTASNSAQYENVRRQAAMDLRASIRGQYAVSQIPSVLLQQAQLQGLNMSQPRSGKSKERTKLETKVQRLERELKSERSQISEIRAGVDFEKQNIERMRQRLNELRKSKEKTPETQVAKKVKKERGDGDARRALFDDGKEKNDTTNRLYQENQIQDIINRGVEEKK